MAASLNIEQESGTYTAGFRHQHNGYYAGDFSQTSRSGSERPDSRLFDRGERPAVATRLPR